MEFQFVITDTSEEYNLVSKTLYTTEQVMSRPVPAYDVMFVAKWSNMDFEDYFPPSHWVVLSADGGEVAIEYTYSDNSSETYDDVSFEAFVEDGTSLKEYCEVDEPFINVSFSNDLKTLVNWTVYEYVEGYIETCAEGETVQSSNPNAKVIPYYIYEDEQGVINYEYLIMNQYNLVYNGISTEELYVLPIDRDYIAVANWSELPFVDVVEKDWYYNAAEYVYKNEIMTGVNETEFASGSTFKQSPDCNYNLPYCRGTGGRV